MVSRTAAPISSISGPVCATVVTKAWPELMPTVARNSVRPKLRSTMLAGSGMTQLIGPVRRSRPTISATISGPPPMPSVTVPTPGTGIGTRPSSTPSTMPKPTET